MPCILRNKKSKRYRRNLSWRKMFNLRSADQELAEWIRDHVYQGLISNYNVYMRQYGSGDRTIYEYLLIHVTGDDWYTLYKDRFLVLSELELEIESHIQEINSDDIGTVDGLFAQHTQTTFVI